MPRQAGEAEGLPRLSPELQPWEEVEAEGVPGLLQGIAGQQTAPQVVLEARRLRPCVFRSRLTSGGQFSPYTEKELLDLLKVAMDERHDL